MTYSTCTPYDFIPAERGPFSRQASPHAASGAAALTLSMVVGGFVLYLHSTTLHYATPDALGTPPVVAPTVTRVVYGAAARGAPAANVYGSLAAAAPAGRRPGSPGTPAALLASGDYVALLDPGFSMDFKPGSIAESAPLGSGFQPFQPSRPTAVANVQPVPLPPVPQQFVQNVPVPAPRPADLQPHGNVPSGRVAPPDRTVVAAAPTAPAAPAAPVDHRSIFQKFFGWTQSSGPELAYASPEDENVGTGASPAPDRWTAVYDISAHVVYMPNGARLEAHSGLGGAEDDPRYVNLRMRGPTPPDIYDLELREQSFHGVQALRLIPVGGGNLYGRSGLLAHTYMLGPHGASFGCVSFKNYNAFLQAYLHGEVKRLSVVARLN